MTLSIGNIVVKQNAEGTGPQEGELSVKFEVVGTAGMSRKNEDGSWRSEQIVVLKELK